jgi:hypothetical protein
MVLAPAGEFHLDASGTTGEILIIALHYCSGMDHGKSSLDRSDSGFQATRLTLKVPVGAGFSSLPMVAG